MLNDKGLLGIKVIENKDIVKFKEVRILEDSEEGIWVMGIPENADLIVQGQGFVEDGQQVLVSKI
jgi:multidrug efflux system membrane fusion protein